MKSKKLFMLLAAVLLSSATAFAQSGNAKPLKGDVNEDGKVDIADVVAVLKIMKDNGGTSGETIYYWYVGPTIPSSLPTDDSQLATGNDPGWRKIGTTKPSAGTLIFNGQITYIEISTTKVPFYFACNSDLNIGIYDSFGNEDTQYMTGLTVSNGMNIYTTTFSSKTFTGVIKVK